MSARLGSSSALLLVLAAAAVGAPARAEDGSSPT